MVKDAASMHELHLTTCMITGPRSLATLLILGRLIGYNLEVTRDLSQRAPCVVAYLVDRTQHVGIPNQPIIASRSTECDAMPCVAVATHVTLTSTSLSFVFVMSLHEAMLLSCAHVLQILCPHPALQTLETPPTCQKVQLQTPRRTTSRTMQ